MYYPTTGLGRSEIVSTADSRTDTDMRCLLPYIVDLLYLFATGKLRAVQNEVTIEATKESFELFWNVHPNFDALSRDSFLPEATPPQDRKRGEHNVVLGHRHFGVLRELCGSHQPAKRMDLHPLRLDCP